MWDLIQNVLDEKNITLRQLAKLAGYKNYSTLYMIKRGNVKDPSFSTMVRIANALDVSLDEFRPKEAAHGE